MDRSIAVAFIVDTLDIGGAERVALALAKEIRSTSFRKRLIITRTSDITSLAGIAEFDVEVTLLNRRSIWDPAAYWRLRQILKEVDIVHAHKYGSAVHAIVWSPIHKRPKIIAHLHTKLSTLGRVQQWLVKYVCNHVDKVLVVSNADLVEHERICGIYPPRIRALPNGIDITERSAKGRDCIRKELGLGQDEFVAVCVGRVDHHKGYHHLIACAAELSAADLQPLHIVIAGDTPDHKLYRELLEMVEQHGLKEQVTFLGYRRDIPDILAAADVFIMPSVVECLPVALLEALAAGIPVIATYVGGIPEVLDNGRYGLLVHPGDPHALRAALSAVMNDYQSSLTTARAAMIDIRSRYSLQSMASSMEAVYQELLHLSE